MYSTPPKRAASASPEDGRPNKRHAPSSPEEGEVDDSPPPPRQATPPPKAKVPFPFKRKAPTREEEPIGSRYQRSREDDRHRYEDRRWTVAEPMRHEARPVPPRGADRWEPSAGRYGHRGGRDNYGGHYHDRERGRSRERERPLYDLPPRPVSPRSVSPRRPSPRRRPPSPSRSRTRSPTRSRSISTPRSRSPSPASARKQTHRLPTRREAESSNVLAGYYRDRGSSIVPRSRSHSRGRSRSKDRQRRAWDDDYDRRGRAYDGYDRDGRRRREENYSLISPRGHQPISHVAAGPSGPQSPHTPPRSPGAPPSWPSSHSDLGPPAGETARKDETLLGAHATIKFALHAARKGPSPLRVRSPPSLEVAAKTDVVPKPKSEEEGQVEEKKPAPPPPVQHRAKRKPVLRSREEEAAVYGRMFVGCGRKDDYNVLTKLGEGTFGEVHKAMHREKGNTVALKRILMHNEKEGMPVTALREIKILKSLHHPNIIDIEDMFVVKSSGKEPLSVYMVFPYMDHDLAGLLENERVKFTPSQIKLYMKQLIEGTEYMHRNHILHRDMKAANLLISNDGSLKIADFGLARAFDPRITQVKEDVRGKERKYTNCVVTRWYRPPELLLGARQYGGEVDMWGIGCVLAEMFWRRPILPGGSDIDQLEKIWQLCGTPNETTWPGWDLLPGCEGVRTWNNYNRRLRHVYEQIGHETVDLLDKLLACNPRERLTAEQALDHDYFWTDPLPADPKSLPKYEASHEFDKRGRREGAGAPPAVSYFVGGPNQRPLPPPMAQGPPQPMYRRPPPPREQFRFGPTNHGLPPPTNHGIPPSSYGAHSHAPQGYSNPQQRFYQPPGPPPQPTALPPISLRPGQPPPGMGQWPPSGPSSGMPPYPPPSMPPRRIHPSSLRHEYGGGAQLNYG